MKYLKYKHNNNYYRTRIVSPNNSSCREGDTENSR